MTKKFKSLLTDKGKALIADAIAGGKTISLKYFAVGDGNGSEVTPSAAQTALVNEVARIELNSVKETDASGQTVAAEAIIPADKGGFWIREAGIFTADGVLVAVSQMPVTYKPDTDDGATSTQTMRMLLAVSDASAISLTVDDSLIIATEAFVSEAIKAHEKSRNHPDASLTEKGFVQLSSKTNSVDEDKAATPKAVKAANDNAEKRLEKENNLSDISDKAKTRSNLELGDAATRDVADNVSGALVPVGYKGNFKSECNHGAIDFATYPFVVGESLFIDVRECTNNPPFVTQDFYYIDVVCATSPAQGGRVNRPLIQFVSYTNSTMILAIREDDGNTINWRYFRAVQYDSDNTTVTIPGALNAVNGSTELSQNAISIRGGGNKHLWFFNTTGDEMGLVYASDDKVLHLRAGVGPSVDVQSNGNVIAPGYLEAKDDIHSGRNISSVGLIQAGNGLYDTPGVRAYSPNNPPPQQDLSPYATSSWVTGNFYSAAQSDARFNFKNTASLSAAGGWQQDGTTGLIMQMGIVNRTDYGTSVTFPRAFPNYCCGVLLTLVNYIGDLSDSGTNIRATNYANTGFTYNSHGNPEYTAFWVAFGQ